MAPAQAECARSLSLVPIETESEEVALNWITGAKQLAVSAAGKSWWTKYPRAQTAVKMEQADYRFHEPATGFGLSHAVLQSAAAGSAAADSMEPKPVTGCEPFLFLVGQVRPLLLEKLTKNSRLVTIQSWKREKCDSR